MAHLEVLDLEITNYRVKHYILYDIYHIYIYHICMCVPSGYKSLGRKPSHVVLIQKFSEAQLESFYSTAEA